MKPIDYDEIIDIRREEEKIVVQPLSQRSQPPPTQQSQRPQPLPQQRPQQPPQRSMPRPQPLPRRDMYPQQSNQSQPLPKRDNYPYPVNFGISRRTKLALWIFAILLMILLVTQILWSNINASDGKYSGTTTVESPDVQVPVNIYNNNTIDNDHTINIHINNTIVFPEELIIKLINITNGTG